MERWNGKVAVVTGASSGIGASIAEKLVEAGLQVVGLARREEKVKELAKKLSGKKGKLHAVKTDLTKEEEVINAFKWTVKNVGPISILINNAGLTKSTNLTDGSTADWKQILDTNILGLCISTREAVRSMKENNIAGHIVHINSIAGHTVPNFPNLNVYPASKHAVTALTETLRIELNSMGSKIKITSVSPGYVKTEIMQTMIKDKPLQVQEEMIKLLSLSPALESEDIANAVLYTLSTPPNVQVHEIIIKPIGEAF